MVPPLRLGYQGGVGAEFMVCSAGPAHPTAGDRGSGFEGRVVSVAEERGGGEGVDAVLPQPDAIFIARAPRQGG